MIQAPNLAKAEILYVQDALCGWCYGFSPVIDQIRARFGNRLVLTPVHGGLWPGPLARKMDSALVTHLLAGMPSVTAATGQVFGTEFRKKIVENHQFVYDTEPAARAAIVVRALSPGHELDFIKDIQTAFFVHGQDPTRTETFLPIVAACGIELDHFTTKYDSIEATASTRQDFARSRAWGVTVFPTLLYRRNGCVSKISAGSCTLDHLVRFIEPVLEQTNL